MKKSIMLLLLCAVMVMSVAVTACNNTDNGDASKDGSVDVSTTSGETVSGWDSENNRYVAALPEFSSKWNVGDPAYETFEVCVISNEIQTTYFSEEISPDLYDTTDETLNEAVKKRNNYVEELTGGVKITAVPVADIVETVRTDAISQTGDFDAALMFVDNAATLAQEDLLYDLHDFSEYIQLSMPWWDQNANDTHTIDGKMYFAVGDITIMQKIDTFAMTFNKKMYADYFPDRKSLYDIVKDGDWTFDLLVELGKTVTADTDGVAGMTYSDTWGLSSSHGDAITYYLGSGQKLITKNEDDEPVIEFGKTEATISTAQKILTQLQLKDTWCILAQDFGTPNIWVTSLDIFGQGRALFRTSVFSAIKKLRNYEDGIEFGIVPLPKVNDTQETYIAPCQGAYAIVIPTSAPNPEYSAYMIELTCCEAKNYITDAYYEGILKYRDMRDDESEEMLDDYIFSNVIYDLGHTYNFGGIASMFGGMMAEKSTNVVSKFESIKPTVESKIQEVLDNYADNK